MNIVYIISAVAVIGGLTFKNGFHIMLKSSFIEVSILFPVWFEICFITSFT